VEHEDHVGIALPMLLRHIEGPQTERGAPVHLADTVAGGELADVPRLDAFPKSTRHVVSHRGLGAAGARQTSPGRAPGMHTRSLALHVAPLRPPEAPRIAHPDDERPQIVDAAHGIADLVAPACRLARPERHHRAMASRDDGAVRGQWL